jgi:hypothetical protein
VTTQDEFPAQPATEWAGLVGLWEFEGASATWLGNELQPSGPTGATGPSGATGATSTSGPPGIGLAVSDLSFRHGAISANITLSRISDTGRIVFGRDRAGTQYYSVGIGSENFAYVLDRFEAVRGGWTPIYVVGSSENLKPDHPYEVVAAVAGQRVMLTVDGVQVFEAVIPAPLEGEGLGVIGWGVGGVEFHDVQTYTVRPRAFAVMEFGSPFDAMYSDVIQPVCEDLGLTIERADDWYRPGVIMDDIIQAITQADLVIAEITPKNPNVYYELGYAHAAGVPTVLLFTRKEDERMPFDVSGQRAIFYEDSIGGKSAVERDLRKHVESVLNRT